MNNNIYKPKVFTFYDYSFHSDGTVYNKSGKKLNYRFNEYGTAFVVIREPIIREGKLVTKQKKVAVAIFIYRSYHKIDPHRRIYIGYKDKNKANCDINNLYEIFGKKGGTKLRHDQEDDIRKAYKNKDRHFNNGHTKDSPSIRDLAKQYGVSVNLIQKVLKDDH